MNPSTPFSVRGKVAVITGAGSGINYEFAKLLAGRGCNVIIGDLSLRPEAQALLGQYATNPKVIFQKTNVSDWADLSTLFTKATSEFGTFDIVCPGAGVFEPAWSNFWQPPGASNSASRDPVEGLGHFAMADINFTHPIRASQLAIAEFLKPSDGSEKSTPMNPKRIIHLGSMACQQGNLAYPMYTATKWGITGFVRSLAGLEQTHGIRVNAVAPGIVLTPLWTEAPDKMAIVNAAEDIWITPAETAVAMLKLLEDPEMVGGTILEVGHEHTRIIPLFNNEGPKSAQGLVASNKQVAFDEVESKLSQEGWGKPRAP